MKVRAYDKSTNTYFKSDVYAIINNGWFEKYLVSCPSESGDFFILIDYIDKESSPPNYKVNINKISTEQRKWIFFENDELLNLRNLLSDLQIPSERLYCFKGFEEIWSNQEYLAKLIAGEKIPVSDFTFYDVVLNNDSIWNFVENENDISNLMKQFHGFHDSVIVSMNYISGSKNVEDGTCITDTYKKLSIVFDTCWCKSIELVFDGLISMTLNTAGDNYSSIIYDATIKIEDQIVFFYDESVKNIDDMSNIVDRATIASAYSLKWRFLDK